MYPISQSTLDLFLRQYRQVVEITMQKTDGTTTLTEADIIQGGVSVDRYCISGDKIEIGSAIAAELTLKLDNRDGKYDETNFEGAEMFVRLGVKKWDAGRWEHAEVAYIPLGYFTVDETPRKLSSITLSALDRMVQFDKAFDARGLTFPTTIGTLLSYCCTQCRVPLYTTPASLLNSFYTVTNAPSEENLTYRKILRWIGEITATCAYIDWNGQLRMEWYKDTGTDITPALRYTSDMDEKDITVTGVQIEDDERNVYLAGTDQYALKISGNGLLDHDHKVIAAAILEQVGGFTYRPYSCTTKALPHLYPLDRVTYTDKKGVKHASIVTHWTYKPNGRVQLAAKGITTTKAGYAESDPLTAREAAILAAMKKESAARLSSMQQATLALNETIANSLGLHVVEEKKADGLTVYYFCNASTLADSNIIYTFREGGFAWTDDWNDGDPVWKYGFTRDGNAVIKTLNTYKVTADEISAGAVTAEKLSQSYKSSVSDAIADGDATVTQAFQAADGTLKSLISKETKRAEGAESTLSTKIAQTAEDISLLVENGEVRGGIIISAINAETSVKIAASHIDLTGIVTVEGLADGTTEINGACIKTGTLTADRLASSALGGFDIDENRITYGKTSYNDTENDGVFLSPAGIGLGKGAFWVTAEGVLHATEGTIGKTGTGKYPWTIKNTNNYSAIYSGLDHMLDGMVYTVGDAIYLGTDGASWQKNYTSENGAKYSRYATIRGGMFATWGVSNPGESPLLYTGVSIGQSRVAFLDFADSNPTSPVGSGTVAAIEADAYRHRANLSGAWGADRGVALNANSVHMTRDGVYAGLFGGKYSSLFDALAPIRWYRNGDSVQDSEYPRHGGFFADKIKEAMTSCGVSDAEFGVLTYYGTGDSAIPWGYRPDEILALCVYEVQQLKSRVAALES